MYTIWIALWENNVNIAMQMQDGSMGSLFLKLHEFEHKFSVRREPDKNNFNIPQHTGRYYNKTWSRVYFRPNLSYWVYTSMNASIHYIWRDRWSGLRQPINVKRALFGTYHKGRSHFWTTLFLKFILF